MADGTHIQWTDATWQPITGCSVVSPGCTNCYAMKLAGTRLKHHPSRVGLTQDTRAGPVWNGQVRFNEGWLDQPLRWKRPRRIFVCAHGDLFAEGVPDEWIDRVFAVMALCPQHMFQVLTKRTQRMRDYLSDAKRCGDQWCRHAGALFGDRDPGEAPAWPLPNVWLGVSVEDQERADERIPLLLDTPAAVRFISAEPLLGPVDLKWLGHDGDGVIDAVTGEHWIEEWHDSEGKQRARIAIAQGTRLDWVITGGESGPRARGACREWYRSIRDQCQAAGVAYFHKQNGEWIDADEWLAMQEAGRAIYREGDALNGGWEPKSPLTYGQAAQLAAACGRADRFEHQSDGTTLIRVGKHAAGRLLDGNEHSEFPA